MQSPEGQKFGRSFFEPVSATPDIAMSDIEEAKEVEAELDKYFSSGDAPQLLNFNDVARRLQTDEEALWYTLVANGSISAQDPDQSLENMQGVTTFTHLTVSALNKHPLIRSRNLTEVDDELGLKRAELIKKAKELGIQPAVVFKDSNHMHDYDDEAVRFTPGQIQKLRRLVAVRRAA